MFTMRVARRAWSAVGAVVVVVSLAAMPQVLAASPAPAVDRLHPVSAGPRNAAPCQDRLVALLRSAGFAGPNLREAWAIAMRESGGDTTVGPGHPAYNGEDLGLFQINAEAFGAQPWFDRKRLLDGAYNASIAYRLSGGGQDWRPWGLTGEGRVDASMYEGIWDDRQVRDWISRPYRKFTRVFDRLPGPCRAERL